MNTLTVWYDDPAWGGYIRREDVINSGWVRGTGPTINVHGKETYEKVVIGHQFAIVRYDNFTDDFIVI